MSRILVVGATGLIGRAISEQLRNSNTPFLGTSRKPSNSNTQYFDLTDSKTEIRFSEFSDVIVCAGVAGKEVEIDLDHSNRVNITGTTRLIDSAYKAGCSVTFISSSSVFSAAQQGATEHDIPTPATLYGIQKKTIEDYLLTLNHDLASIRIVRPTKILSNNNGILFSWNSQRLINANSAVSIAPIGAGFLAKFLLSLIKRREYGIYHVSGEELINYVEFAKKYIESGRSNNDSWKLNFYFDDSSFQDSATFLRSAHSHISSYHTQALKNLFAEVLSPSLE